MTTSTHSILNKISAKSKKSKLPVTLRSNSDELAYRLAMEAGLSRPLVDESRLKEWDHWALIDNKFPYTAVFKTHHMLIPKRPVAESMLNDDEVKELWDILQELSTSYDVRMVNFKHRQTKQTHFHMHLLVYKNSREELSF